MTTPIQVDHQRDIYVDGEWRPSAATATTPVHDPSTEQVVAEVSAGDPADVDAAVAAARAAYDGWSQTPLAHRVEAIRNLLAGYDKASGDLAEAITLEVGAPHKLSHGPQTGAGHGHLAAVLDYIGDVPFETVQGSTGIILEPIGVAGLITPWNWPLHQILCKVAPALAAGCTMVLKPSEIAPLNAILLTEVIARSGLPAGVFNLVHGLGGTVGAALAGHPGVDLISFTGSTRAGVDVAVRAAPSVKRVTQELGGKSPNVLLDDVDLEPAVRAAVRAGYLNSGQSCNAPTRLLVAAGQHDRAAEIAADEASKIVTGDPSSTETDLGPVISETQFDRVQTLIEAGLAEGAKAVVGGAGRPDGLETGWYVKPTVFAGVTNDMTIARTEIFGPVLSILPYADESEAVRIANDTEYGLAAYVSSGDPERARRVARRLRAGQVTINGTPTDPAAPFGGYKKSGNGREQGPLGIYDYLETKAVMGYGAS